MRSTALICRRARTFEPAGIVSFARQFIANPDLVTECVLDLDLDTADRALTYVEVPWATSAPGRLPSTPESLFGWLITDALLRAGQITQGENQTLLVHGIVGGQSPEDPSGFDEVTDRVGVAPHLGEPGAEIVQRLREVGQVSWVAGGQGPKDLDRLLVRGDRVLESADRAIGIAEVQQRRAEILR
ncbi:MAG TPA: hypothetical protein VFX16_05220 [Pseudonocardiaceae bacterium]|nr:hypothetical protein [Pseudonocardiaceae bacterium]